MTETPPPAPSPGRRDFFKRVAAVVIGGIGMIVPAVSGIFVALDPLRRRGPGGAAVPVASLDALPENGEPRKFPVLATRVDAWNRTPNVPIGAVYLRRVGENRVQAFNVVCPHAGCFVDFDGRKNHYHCPCHNSSFGLDGSIADPKSPSPRGLDELPVEIREGGEIWVTFQNFRAGTRERVVI